MLLGFACRLPSPTQIIFSSDICVFVLLNSYSDLSAVQFIGGYNNYLFPFTLFRPKICMRLENLGLETLTRQILLVGGSHIGAFPDCCSVV